ncbi:MAG TPA: DUF1697 domain-containing protein [Terriglobia bacterium]|nr:DUF1697 domain-containing protein [Terriglobia bacterium]
MTVIISMLRGVNLGPHNRIKMEALRALYASLGLRNPQSYVQSGNVVFRTTAQDLAKLAERIEDGIEKGFGFRPNVILRTTAELREAIAKNPFAARRDIEPGKLLVTFLSRDPGPEAPEKIDALNGGPEELRLEGRELYVYFPNGQARPQLKWAHVEKALKTEWTGRNWNTVRNLLEMAEKLEAVR